MKHAGGEVPNSRGRKREGQLVSGRAVTHVEGGGAPNVSIG